MLGSKKKEEAFPVNEALLNVITPMGLEIKRNSLVIGENLGKVYGAVRYPQKVDMGWLSKITNIPSTIVSVGITPIDNGSLISAISKSIVQQRGAADSAKDPLTRQRAEKAAEDGEKIMQQIDQEGETVAMMSLTVMPIAQDEVNFTKVCRRVESAFNIQKCKVRTLANLQKEGFQSISPTYPANSTVDSIVSRIIPMSTFVGGFPFASSGYNDGRGYYFAKDSNGGLEYLTDADGVIYVKTTTPTVADYAVTVTGKKDILFYVTKVDAAPMYAASAKAFTDFGYKCGQVVNNDNSKYYEITTGADAGKVYKATDNGTLSVLVDGKLVKLDNTAAAVKEHNWSVSASKVENGKVIPTEAVCGICGSKSTAIYETGKAPAGSKVETLNGVTGYVVVPNGTSTTPSTGTTTKPSPKTFDAGIAMYVGMALTSVAGSALVIGKKKEF